MNTKGKRAIIESAGSDKYFNSAGAQYAHTDKPNLAHHHLSLRLQL